MTGRRVLFFGVTLWCYADCTGPIKRTSGLYGLIECRDTSTFYIYTGNGVISNRHILESVFFFYFCSGVYVVTLFSYHSE